MANIESGRNKGSTELVALARALQCSPDWLDTGEKPEGFYERGAEPEATMKGIAPVQVARVIPLISSVRAGMWHTLEDPYAVGDAEDWLPVKKSCGPRSFALRVDGPSMFNPGGSVSYEHGDIIFVDPDREAVNGSDVVVRLEDTQETTFKQLIIEGNRQYLMARNPSWPNRIMEVTNNATICGVVFQLQRDVVGKQR